MMKNNKGITIVALAIVIIIMLILAGVAIRGVMGEDGTINEAKNMSQSAKYNNVLELIKMDILAEKNKRDTNRISSATIENILSRYSATCLKETVENIDGSYTDKIKTIVLEDNSTIDFNDLIKELKFEVVYEIQNVEPNPSSNP